MKRVPVVPVAWGIAAMTVGCCIVAWLTAVPGVELPRGELRALAAWGPAESTDLRGAAATIRDRNPFRIERRPTVALYNPWSPGPAVAVEMPVAPSRPVLALSGVLGGPPWLTLVEGVPGRTGAVLLALGDEVNGVRFAALRNDTAVLAGFDTTWMLTTRRTW